MNRACSLVILASLLTPWISAPTAAAAAFGARQDSADAHRHHDNRPPVPWTQLDTGAQRILAPLKPRWERMPAHVQHHIMRKAKHWETLPQSRREAIRQRIARWEKMSPAERRRARANHRAYRHLDSTQRQRLHEAYERYRELPADQQHQLRRQWHRLSPAQRRQWIRAGANGDLPQPDASAGHR